MRDVALPYASNGMIGLIFTASGPIAVTLAFGAAGGLMQSQLASWVFGILFSGGAATLVMSLLYRQPLGFAWSIPGTVLLGPSLQHLSFPEVVGAFFASGCSSSRWAPPEWSAGLWPQSPCLSSWRWLRPCS